MMFNRIFDCGCVIREEGTDTFCEEHKYSFKLLPDRNKLNVFDLTLDEARALNSLLRLHHGLFREMPEYIHLLRLINGLSTFVDKHDKK